MGLFLVHFFRILVLFLLATASLHIPMVLFLFLLFLLFLQSLSCNWQITIQICIWSIFVKVMTPTNFLCRCQCNSMQCMLHVTCYMSHMLHVTNIKLQTILPMTQCVIYFWKAYTKYSSMLIIKTLHVTCVTCVTCNMSHMLHVTNIKLKTILLKTPCVIYFWKAHAKYS